VTDRRQAGKQHISAGEMYSTICVEWAEDYFGLKTFLHFRS